jgi:similar to stage IV sporulation protein
VKLLLFRLWNYLRGYVIIIVEGYFLEKFINICARRKIPMWDVRMQSKRLVTMRMTIKGFRLVRPAARKSGCRVRLLKKTGMPFVFNRYRRRKAFFAGAVLFILLINLLASFIWSIEIVGNNELETSFIEGMLESNGIRTGALKYGINTDRAVERMMLEIDKLSWISIYIRGTKVKVELRERRDIPEIVPRHVPCDIVAQKDGIIKQVIAKEGIEAVGEGDTVKKGQVLISGSIPLKGPENENRLVHAMGIVNARTWYEEESPVVTDKTVRLKTGRVIRDSALILFSWKLDLFHRKNSFKYYTAEETGKKLTIGENLVFPLELVTISYYEEKIIGAHISEEDARRNAADEAYRKALDHVPEGAEVVDRKLQFIDKDGVPTARVILECIEDIGVSKRIGGN